MYFSGKSKGVVEKMLRCLNHTGPFKYSRIFYVYQITLVLSHMNQVPLILQTNALGWLVSEVSFKHWDLGSIPRSPPFSISFCLMCSYAACILRSIMHPPSWSATCLMRWIWRSGSGVHHGHQSNAPHTIPEKSKRPPPDGPKFLNLPPKLGSTPPIGLHIIFFLFIFSIYLFYLF